MQTHITCDCGNRIQITDDQTNVPDRCPICGRRIFAHDADALGYHAAQSDFPNQQISAEQSDMKQKTLTSFSFLPVSVERDAESDPESTVLLTTAPSVPSGTSNDLSPHPALGDSGDDFVTHHRMPVMDDDYQPSHDSSLTGTHGSSSTIKYDLTKRVMRAIVKPAIPAIPYTGTGEYGIHRVLRIHRKGGMGRILVAYDQYLKREVAIKELHPEVAEDDSIVQRFIGEAEITAQLEHPGIVPIHRIGQGQDGLPYYTMKLVKGGTLQDVIKAYHRDPQKKVLQNLVRYVVSVSKTIAFAHNKGVIHRDLKPANVMIGEYGETLVMDWGLAKPYSQGSDDTYISIINNTKHSRPELTMTGAIVGTPAFMSPEQANAEDHLVGPLSDVFSLGTILYYLLAGQTAFSGRSAQEVLSKVRTCHPVPPSQIKPYVPRPLETICLKAMSKSPGDRYQGAMEFADDLCRWLDGNPVAAQRNTFFSKMCRYFVRHYMISIAVPVILLLSLTLAAAEVWLLKFFDPVAAEVNRPTAVPESTNVVPSQILQKKGVDVVTWQDHRSIKNGLSLTCRTLDGDEHQRSFFISESDDVHWGLSEESVLTFSLTEMGIEKRSLLENFSIWLGHGDTYYEYKPSQQLWKNRNEESWSVTISLGNNSSNWRRTPHGETLSGTLKLQEVQWLKIHFDAPPDTVLNFDHIRFVREDMQAIQGSE